MAESKRKGKAKKFNLEWIVKYGLEVSTRDPSTSEVTTPWFASSVDPSAVKMPNESGKDYECQVCAERDNRNNSGDHLPHVLPLELCGVLLRDFVSCLEDQRIRLGHKFSEAEVENIDEQFRKLRLAFKEHSGFSQMLLDAQASRAVQSFEKCWSQLGSEFEQLSMFCGALQALCQVQAVLSLISP
ncbi:hypothetical protein IV203_011066 [Nitzschia inconspicua]|uniref:Uncharacterized protein n=1 Tax=Nitzschia inconspicua TaxID=303405 RepID=A0A9K3K7W9_9STRA|nr:hypothetical protein IV203_011066 [Nitzschia inconspicua]